MGTLIVSAAANGPVLTLTEGLSLWGGTDPMTGLIIDAHHPQHGASLAGKVVMMPTTRGSCSGSGGLLELAMNGKAPAALIFRAPEDIVTVGAMVATQMFDLPVAVVRLSAADYAEVANAEEVRIDGLTLNAGALTLPLALLTTGALTLTAQDRAMLDGAEGRPVQLAMEMICRVAALQGATHLTDVTRVHIDGCIYGGGANLGFAEKMAEMGAKTRVPTTMNAISVDHANWRAQDVPPDFGLPAQRLADAYLKMGARPTFTCAPYQADDAPTKGEDIGWSESNAVVYANTVLGARTVKHPDYFDLFIALTGRAPLSGVYLDANRVAQLVIELELPNRYDDALWPMLGWLIGQSAPDCIPLVRGLESTDPSQDDLRAICAAFGTTSAEPLLHIAGVTPEGHLPPETGAPTVTLARAELIRAWQAFNPGPEKIDLIALGSPHFSLTETRVFSRLMDGKTCANGVNAVITLGRETLTKARAEGLISPLETAGVRVIPDLCWCSITEPLFPPSTKTLMTNSGKYAHYAPGLHGRAVRFGDLKACALAAQTGHAPKSLPDWLA